MSIASALTNLSNDIDDARDAIEAKGGTVTPNGGSSQLATDIATIPQSGGGGNDYDIPMEVQTYYGGGGEFRRKTASFNYKIPNSASELGTNALTYAFWNAGVAKIDFNNITTIGTASCSEMCYRCQNLTEVKFPNVTTIQASGLSQAFRYCALLGDIYFPSLQDNFDGYTSAFDNMFQNTANLTAHFPVWMRPVMENWTSVQNGFGSTTGRALFDLHATELDFTITPNGYILYVNGELIIPNQQVLVNPYDSNNYLIENDNLNKYVYAELSNLSEDTTVPISVNMNTMSTNRLSISTGVTGLTGTITVGGQAIDLTETSTGVYSIDINVASGISFTYLINGGNNYNDATGTITTTGSDVTVTVTMTPATLVNFVRPDLVENGTMGGNAFAVDASSEYLSYYAWKAVDDSSTTYWRGATSSSEHSYTFYNPNALRVSQLTIVFYSTSASYQAGAIVISGSNDGSAWTEIMTDPKPESGIGTRTITVNASSFYKYYKMELSRYGTSGAPAIKDLGITAVYKQ